MNTHKCEKCGSSLFFNSATGQVQCKKCGAISEVKITKDINRHHIDLMASVIDTASKSVSTKHCNSCGAIFTGENGVISDICEYCGATLVIDFSKNGGMLPDACIPFAFDPKGAAERFIKHVKKQKFVSNSVKNKLNAVDVESLYIPAYTFDADTTSSYDGEIYSTHEDRDGDRRTVYRKIKGTRNVIVKNAMIECSSKFSQAEFNEIKPYDTTQIRKFDQSYILGYSVEDSDREFNDIRKSAKLIIDSKVKNSILSQYSYDGVEYLHIDTAYNSVNYSYIILPTYKIKYTYKNKEYTHSINGQTGKVGGKLPLSGWKIFGFILSLIGGVGLFVLLIILMMGGFFNI